MHRVVEVLGENISMILPLIHAFSGCYWTSELSGMGKERWIEVAILNQELVDGLESLGNNKSHVSEETEDVYVALVSLMYVGKVYSSLQKEQKKVRNFPQQWMHLNIIYLELIFRQTFRPMPRINIWTYTQLAMDGK